MTPDVIVIGAGVNGLVAAHYLARAGRRVLVLERAREPDPSPDVGWVPPQIVRDLDLARRGLAVERPDPWLTAVIPGARPLELFHDLGDSAESIRRLSPDDAVRWPEFCRRTRRMAAALARLYAGPPPDPHATGVGEWLRLGWLGLRTRLRGRESVVDLLRTPPMAIGEVLDRWFETAALKGALAALGVWHLRQGPRGGGTAFNFLHHHVGSPLGVFRPARCNLGAVLATLPGVEIRRGAAVTRVDVRDGRVRAVVLEGGEEILARLVVSGLDPRRTLLGLVDAKWLDPEFVRAVRNVKCRGVVARVTLDCEGAPGFGQLAIAPSVDYLERAFDHAKYGLVSAEPYLEAWAEAGRLVVHVQYVPYRCADGAWDDARRHALGELVRETLAGSLPAPVPALTVREVATPADFEEWLGPTEGHLYHGELTLDQILFMRPVAGWSRSRTPIGGLYLCGPGTHPGGAVLGAAGRLAARALLSGRA